jgi:predicted DsbA family dithiol-disulfide isomerase
MAKENNILLNEAPASGKQTAKAKFVKFFDFTCIHCMDEFIVLEKLLKKYPEDISVSFKFFPLDGNCFISGKGRNEEEPEACIASAAGFCGHRQGKFMECAKILFENYHKKDIKFTGKTLRDAAMAAGLDIAGFDLCFGSKQAREFVGMEYAEAEMLKISSTPTLFLNGKRLPAGSRKEDIFEGLINYCMQRSK